MATICIHCMHLLVGNSQQLCARTGSSFLSYSAVAETALATADRPWLRPYSRYCAVLCCTALHCVAGRGG